MPLSGDSSACVNACLDAHLACLGAAMRRSMIRADRPFAPEQADLLLETAEFCRTTASAVLLGARDEIDLERDCADLCLRASAEWEGVSQLKLAAEACRLAAAHCLALTMTPAV
jgi:hypothetical protein